VDINKSFQVNPLSAKKSKKSKVKVTLCQRVPRFPALRSLITGGFTFDRNVFSCCIQHLALKGLTLQQ